MNLGANFQAEVAAFFAVLALSEDTTQFRDELGGSRISRVGAEQNWPMDDIAVWLESGAMGFVQVKSSLTSSAEATSTLAQVFDQITLQAIHGRGRDPGEDLRPEDRLLLVVGDGASSSIKSDLTEGLRRLRLLPTTDSIEAAAQGQLTIETQLNRAVEHVQRRLSAASLPGDEVDARRVLRHVQIISISGSELVNRSRLLLDAKVISDPAQIDAAYALLVRYLAQAAQHRTSYSVADLRVRLREAGIQLREPPSIAEDVRRIVKHTERTLEAETRTIHTREGAFVVPRAVTRGLCDALALGNLVVTSEAGAGKSGVLLEAAIRLRNAGERVVFIDATDPAMADPASAMLLSISLEDVLSRWGDVANPSYLLIDGFDSLRLGVAFDRLVRMLRRIGALEAKWRIAIASREYDLLNTSSEIAALFPFKAEQGIVPESRDERFSSISHILVKSLDDAELEYVMSQSPSLASLIDKVPAKVGELLRNSFNLSVVADLTLGTEPLPDLSNVADRVQLLDLWWDRRVSSGASALAKESALRNICKLMLSVRQLRLEVDRIDSSISTLPELLSAAVLLHPDAYRSQLAFRHALLFDYAVFRLLLSSEGSLAKALGADRDAFLFILPSVRMRFATLWTNDRKAFFRELTSLFVNANQRRTFLMVVARIVFEHLREADDLVPLLDGDDAASDAAVRYIVRCLIYAREHGEMLVGSSSQPWSSILLSMAGRLPRRDHDTLLVLSELSKSKDNATASQLIEIAAAARLSLESQLAATSYNQIFMRMAVGAFIQTFDVDVNSARPILDRLLERERLVTLGHLELEPLTFEVNNLHDVCALEAIYTAIFSDLEVSNEKVQLGAPSVLMGFVQDGRQSLSMARWALAQRFKQFLSEHPAAAVRVLSHVLNVEAHDGLSKEVWIELPFHGHTLRLLRDISNVWDSRVYHIENWFKMVEDFEASLRSSLESGDPTLLQATVDELIRNPGVAFLWRVLLRNADAAPQAANLLAPILESHEALISYELREPIATFLAKAYHLLREEQRARIDHALLSLETDDAGELQVYRRELLQVYLASIPSSHLVDDNLRTLLKVNSDSTLTADQISYERSMVLAGHVDHGLTTSRIPLSREVKKAGGSAELVDAIDAVESVFYGGANAAAAQDASVIAPAIRLINNLSANAPPPVRENALDILAAFVRIGLERKAFTKDERRALLPLLVEASAAEHPKYTSDKIAERELQFAKHPSWGSPAARTDSVQALWMLYREERDAAILSSIRHLANDADPAVRFLAVQGAGSLADSAPQQGWELVDVGARDANVSVLTAALQAAQYLGRTDHGHYVELFLEACDRLFGEGDPKRELARDLLRWLLARLVDTNDAAALQRLDPILKNPWAFPEHSKTLAFLLAQQTGSDPDLRLSRNAATVLGELVDRFIERADSNLTLFGGDVSKYPEPQLKETETALQGLKEVAERLYFASGVIEQVSQNGPYSDTGTIDPQRYSIISPILESLANLRFSGTAYYVVKILNGAVNTVPKEVLLLGARAIRNGVLGGLTREMMAEDDVREFVQRYVDGHRGLLEQERECLAAVMDIIDAFVDAGWPKWIDTVYELDRLYREA